MRSPARSSGPAPRNVTAYKSQCRTANSCFSTPTAFRSPWVSDPASRGCPPPACPAAEPLGAAGENAPMARRTTKQPLPDDFEEHILDIDVGDEMRSSFLEYAYSRHLLPRAARRPRRAQAGAAPDPLHDGRHEPAPRPRARQERPRRRRGHGPAAPPRRQRDLRRAGADGPAVVDAGADHRRPRQLRLARRLPRRHALHRVPDGAGGGRDDRLDRRGHRRLQAQLRQPRDRADASCRRRSPT